MKYLSTVFILVLGVTAFGQAKKPLPKTKTSDSKTTIATASDISKTSTVQISAGFIFKDGNTVPAASNTFYLLSEDLSVALNTPKMKELIADDVENSDYDSLPEFSPKELKKGDLVSLLRRIQLVSFPTYAIAAKAAIAKAIKYQTITDSQGKAEFKDLPPGKYFLFGEYRTNNTGATWYIPVKADGGLIKVNLDLNNRLAL